VVRGLPRTWLLRMVTVDAKDSPEAALTPTTGSPHLSDCVSMMHTTDGVMRVVVPELIVRMSRSLTMSCEMC